MIRLLPLLLALSACKHAEEVPTSLDVKVVTWNVGNGNDEEPHYPLRLSYTLYEDYVAAQLQALDADVIALQEVLPRQTCEAFTEEDPSRTCYGYETAEDAAARLVGPGYSVVCDARQHVECVAIRASLGAIRGLELEGYDAEGAETPPLPLPSCVYADGACGKDLCDAESTVSAVTVDTEHGPLRVVHGHPNASGMGDRGFFTGEECRALQLEQIFEGIDGEPALVAGYDRVVVLGDMNYDVDSPVQGEDEVAVWQRNVGPVFTAHDPVDEDGEAYHTLRTFPLAIDHVLSLGATGTCEVMGQNGFDPDPDTEALDAGFDFAGVGLTADSVDRIDHFAVVCSLSFPLER
ncbi:MAG: endonuclease/exonuclease/phosphatase family protein [Deltaproteobacteria bacterium]|nr:endonuclease/exonuclease/phosphatase family protein [Deltaproteobacteria bacterium]